MDAIELRKLRRTIRPFISTIQQSYSDLDSDETGQRYHEFYDMFEAASGDPNFGRYVPPITYWASGPGRQPLSRKHAILILTSAKQLFAYLDNAVGPENQTMTDVSKAQEQRYLFLKRLHDLTGGDEYQTRDPYKLAGDLGFDEPTADRILQFLRGEDLIVVHAEDMVAISHVGNVQIEQGLQRPDQSTKYFPAVTNMHITINDAHISGGFNIGSTVRDSYNTGEATASTGDLQALLKKLAEAVDKMTEKLSEDGAGEAARDLTSLTDEALSKAPRSKHWEVSMDGLKKAAADVGEIGKPVILLAGQIATLLLALQK